MDQNTETGGNAIVRGRRRKQSRLRRRTRRARARVHVRSDHTLKNGTHELREVVGYTGKLNEVEDKSPRA